MSPDYAAILAAVQRDPRYLKHLTWGEPRPGHPEGTVQAHIVELERNLSALQPILTDEETGRIRLLIHTHDTFKAQASRGVAIEHPQSHASLAREFLAEFVDDEDLLAMVQFHDEPFALWRQANQDTPNALRFERLLQTVRAWDTFLAFLIVDNATVGKDQRPLLWFFDQLRGRRNSRITADDIRRLPRT